MVKDIIFICGEIGTSTLNIKQAINGMQIWDLIQRMRRQLDDKVVSRLFTGSPISGTERLGFIKWGGGGSIIMAQ